jgi:hypothetical protein
MSPPQVVVPSHLPAPELSLYRDRCLALLHRYFTMSVEVGRLPALLGREVFRTRARSYRLTSFEDVVIFVHDVERCLARLDRFDHELIVRLVFQEYTQEETAALLKCTRQTVGSRYPDALDSLTEIFLELGLLRPHTRRHRKCAQPAPKAGVDLACCAEPATSLPHHVPVSSHIGSGVAASEKLVKPSSTAIFALSA